jgi:hypothetical protein
VERDTAIFGVDCSIVAKEQVATNKGASTLHAFEGAFFRVWWMSEKG